MPAASAAAHVARDVWLGTRATAAILAAVVMAVAFVAVVAVLVVARRTAPRALAIPLVTGNVRRAVVGDNWQRQRLVRPPQPLDFRE